jgi:hypothetical protein
MNITQDDKRLMFTDVPQPRVRQSIESNATLQAVRIKVVQVHDPRNGVAA